MRNALNALQSTVSGFALVTADNVFKVSYVERAFYAALHLQCSAVQLEHSCSVHIDLLQYDVVPR